MHWSTYRGLIYQLVDTYGLNWCTDRRTEACFFNWLTHMSLMYGLIDIQKLKFSLPNTVIQSKLIQYSADKSWTYRIIFLLSIIFSAFFSKLSEETLPWRHNERGSVSNHQPRDCSINCLFRRRSKKKSKLPITGLCAVNSPVTAEFPAQMASNAENASIWWRHHEITFTSDRYARDSKSQTHPSARYPRHPHPQALCALFNTYQSGRSPKVVAFFCY